MQKSAHACVSQAAKSFGPAQIATSRQLVTCQAQARDLSAMLANPTLRPTVSSAGYSADRAGER